MLCAPMGQTTRCRLSRNPCDPNIASAAQAVVENAQHYVLERKSWFAKKVFPETVDLEVTTTLLVDDAVSWPNLE